MSQEFKIRAIIDQFTEIPMAFDRVEERSSWMRNWSSWRNVHLDKLPLIHLTKIEQEREERTSRLAVLENIRSSLLIEGITNYYSELSSKLNILSLITERGYWIISIHPAPPLNTGTSKVRLIDKLFGYAHRSYWNSLKKMLRIQN